MRRRLPILLPVLAAGPLARRECLGAGPARRAAAGRRPRRTEPGRAGRFHRAALGAQRAGRHPIWSSTCRAPRVSITSAFQGESILLFGMFDPPGEIVVVVAGPAGARDGAAQAALPRPVAQHRPPGLRRRAGLLLHRRQPAPAAPARPRRAAARSCRWRIGCRACGSVGQRDHQDLIKFRLGLVEVKRREGLYPASHRPGHRPGRPAVPGRAAVSLAPAGGRLRGADLSVARRQDRRGGVAAAAGRQGRVQRPAGRLGGR